MTASPPADELAQWLGATGQLDVAAIPEFEACARDLVERPRCRCVVVDLTDVRTLDTGALGALMRVAVRSQQLARRLVIVPPASSAGLVLRTSGVDRHLPLVDSRRVAAGVVDTVLDECARSGRASP